MKEKPMKRKFFIFSVVLVPSSFVFAENNSGQLSPFTGPFLEGGIGGDWGEIQGIRFYDRSDAGEIPGIRQDNRKKLYSGVSGKIALGYGHVFSKIFYLGGQVYGKFSSQKKIKVGFQSPVRGGSAQLRKTDSLGVRFHPGVILFGNSKNPTLFHLIVGWGSSQWKLKEALYIDAYLGKSVCPKIREKITLGVGFLTKVYKNLSAGLEFTYTPLQKFTISKYETNLQATPWAVVEDYKKPNNKTVMFKISYAFRV